MGENGDIEVGSAILLYTFIVYLMQLNYFDEACPMNSDSSDWRKFENDAK